MKPSDSAAEQEALATLQMIRDHLDVTELSAEDRETVVEWWATSEEPEPQKVSLGGPVSALVFPVFDPRDLEPRLVPCMLAFQAFAIAIKNGLPGAELVTQEFLRDCGFEEAAAQEILEQMVARAPSPDPEALN